MRTYNSYAIGFSNGAYLSTIQVAEWFGKHPRTIQRYREQGMPYHDMGTIMHLEMEIREWVKNRKRKGRK